MTTYSDGSPSSVHTTDFVYDGNQIVLQFDKDGTGNVTANDLSHRYLNGPAVDQVLADERVILQNGALATDEVLWTLADAQGTVRDVALLSGTTSVKDHIIYSSFGGVVNESDASQGCLFKYTGCATDPATDIEFHFQRPRTTGSFDWLKIDQSGYTSGTTNLNDYCGNDPINATDPSGLADGMHWVPQAVCDHLANLLSKEAIDVFKNGTTGALTYWHGNDTWYGLTHSGDYNPAVETLLKNYKELVSPAEKLSGEEAATFLKWIVKGTCTNAKFLKANKGLWTTVFTYRKGLWDSEMIGEAIAKLNSELTPQEVKAAIQKVMNGTESKYLSEAAAEVAAKVASGAAGKALKAAARHLGPIIMFISAAAAASSAYADGGGVGGATSAAIRDAECAELVEDAAVAEANLLERTFCNGSTLAEAQQRYFLKRFGNVIPEPLNDEQVNREVEREEYELYAWADRHGLSDEQVYGMLEEWADGDLVPDDLNWLD